MKKTFTWVLLALIASAFISCSTTVLLLKVEPASHNFGQVNIGTTATFDFILTNKKSVDMTLTAVSFQTAEFTEITNAQGKIITAKGTLLITVQFAPALPGGNKTDTMHLDWTDITDKTGKKDVKLKGEAVPVSIINAPTTYDFGTVGIAQAATHNFNIQNTGTADLTLSLFNFNGNATLFSITAGGVTPVTIIPGSIHTVTVQFAPITTGNFPTVLEISHNAVNVVSPHQINIAAAGGGGRIEVNQPSPWDIGTAPVGGSSSDDIEISNAGSITLNISNISLVTGTEFTIENIEDSSGNPITLPFGIDIGDFVVVTIKFEPTTYHQFNDTLSIENDGSYAVSPLNIELVGTGRAPITQTFNFTGAAQQWTVPAGLRNVEAETWGAEGNINSGYNNDTGLGGKGGYAKGTFIVAPGNILHIYVGGKSGFNGGGASGPGTSNDGAPGGNGGGASDIRLGGTTLADRKIIAGGGGGGGGNSSNNSCRGGAGGDGGYIAGTSGIIGYSSGHWAGRGGGGGTQAAGGAGGQGYTAYANSGILGSGGGGDAGSGTWGGGGGAGGAGYYGGGGGGGGYGGSGGGGGGGSSFIAGLTNTSTTTGIRTGDGQISVNY